MTQVVRIYETGGPEVLRIESVDLPSPKDGEVRVRHTAVGLNFIDTYHRTGLYQLSGFPHGLGVEAAGVVEALGSDVLGFELGQRVAYAGGAPGAYAQARNVPARLLVPLPAHVSDEVAAAGLLKGMTVEYLIRRTVRIEAGDTVLLHAAAGGVGLIACQWLRHLGARVLGTVSSDEKAKLARQHGCDEPIVTSREDFVSRVHELTGGRGVRVVYDSVGKDTFSRSLDCLQLRGTLVSFGNASGKPDPLDISLLSDRGSLFVTRPKLFDYTAKREELLASAAEFFSVIESGAVQVSVQQRFALADAAEAHRALEGRRTTGSTILVP
jgi:NADPH2:quinone reductase